LVYMHQEIVVTQTVMIFAIWSLRVVDAGVKELSRVSAGRHLFASKSKLTQ